jgi:DNA-binding NarL/FixJ family response regulator
MKVLIAFGNQLISRAVKELLEKSGGEYTRESFRIANDYSADTWKAYEIIITDYPSLTQIPKDCIESSSVLVMDYGLEKQTVVSLFLTEKIAGLVPADAGIDTLLKAIQVVGAGEVWIDNSTLKALLNRSVTRKVKDTSKLTERENAITSLVREGHRNKEIANILEISEQTVKSHLNRIFRKTNVSARTELMAHFSSGAH